MPRFGFPVRNVRSSDRAAVPVVPPPSANSVAQVLDALRQAAELATQLDAEVRRQSQTLESLQARIASQERIAAVSTADVRVITRLVASAIDVRHNRLRRVSRRDQLLFFALGVLASIPVQLLVDWLT
ncbi:hypothetical protein [Plantactinospora sp. WMMB782]|uniref:hypothetical protein n=1 Tax=Plantactinospora sp. WMMB782 TaxID=3404121 RepID=UPI003B92D743